MSGPSLVILAAGRARRYGGLKQLAPIGRHGEGVIDLIASDAISAGFDDIVIVLNHDTGPTIQEHVAAHWPKSHRVSFAFQEKLRGTVDAVLAAEEFVDHNRPFAVSNADDLYGLDALMKLGNHLATSPDCCMVAFQLENSLIGDLPVSRGTCQVSNGRLTHVEERRNVHFTPDGLEADDDLTPRILEPDTLVSMNLWGFQPEIWPLMHREVEEHDFSASAEVLLPTFVARIMANDGLVVSALETSSRCIGVTHAEDLPLAQFLVREEIKSGLRPEYAFT
ncbi:MAG TPA: sugar phosphate nucleotidyltransferase [Acidimicrobiales bacterium]